MCYSFNFKDTLTLDNQPFFKRMEILICDTHWPFSAIISPFQLTQHHSSEGCLFTLEKNLWCRVLGANKKQVPWKILSGNKNQFCQSNIFGSFSNLKSKGCAHVLLGKGSGKIWTCSCWEKGNFIMINEFKYGQTWKIWPSPLSLSLYNPFKEYMHKKVHCRCLH